MARQGDIFAEIRLRCPPEAFDLTRAEGRADWDDALRGAVTELAGDDETLKRHAADMIAVWRRKVLWVGRVEPYEYDDADLVGADDGEISF